MSKRILVINPGSTSTKIAVFEGERKLFDETQRYTSEELSAFHWVMEQVDFRKAAIEKALAAHGFDLTTLDGICARGGQLPPCESGTYLVDQTMVDYMYTVKNAAHASNLGCVLALQLAQGLKIPAFICDPVSVDEMVDEARITGLPEIRRTMLGHALNCRAMARRCAEEVRSISFGMDVFSLCWQGGGTPPISFIVYHNRSGICSGQMAKICRGGQKTFAKIEIYSKTHVFIPALFFVILAL